MKTINKKTTNKILTTSIVAFAVLALMVPANMAHATLIGDDVTIVLDGADTNNHPDAPNVTDTVLDSSSEANFSWSDVGCAADDGVSVDIEDSTIEVSWGGGFGLVVICDTGGTRIDQPLNFTLTSLDWVGVPGAIITGVSETSSSGMFATSATVLGDHSVEVTVDIGDSEGGTVVFTLEKTAIEVEKSWTHTDYNWDPVCDGIENATGCFTLDGTSILDLRPANINATTYPEDDVLADPLSLDSNGNYTAFAQVHKNDKFSNTNPGAFYALTTMVTTASLSSVTVIENYSDCTIGVDHMLNLHNDKKLDRSVKVAIADPNGDVTEITGELYDGVNGSISPISTSSATVNIDREIDAGSTVYVLVKFQDDLKGFDTGNGIFDDMCHNTETVIANIGGDDFSGVVAEADLRITNQE